MLCIYLLPSNSLIQISVPVVQHALYRILQHSELVCESSCAESQAFVMGEWFLKDTVICALCLYVILPWLDRWVAVNEVSSYSL